MDAEERARRGLSFGAVAGLYAANRPAYPVEAATWLLGPRPARVLELGAGTGKLTSAICALGHDVVATDPSPEMVARLRTNATGAHCVLARAEDIPLPSASVDVVVAAQAFHWFDAERALPEIARVLRPGGSLSLVWNTGDGRVPWVRKLFALTGTPMQIDAGDPFENAELFTLGEQRTFKHWQTFRKPDVLGFLASQSRVVALTPQERDDVLAEAAALYDSYGRGPDGLQMPWLTQCYRGWVSGMPAGHHVIPSQREDPDDGLLIDFN